MYQTPSRVVNELGIIEPTNLPPTDRWPTAAVQATWNFMTLKQIYLRLSFVSKIWMQAKWHSIRLKVLFKTLCTCPRSCPVCYFCHLSFPPQLFLLTHPPSLILHCFRTLSVYKFWPTATTYRSDSCELLSNLRYKQATQAQFALIAAFVAAVDVNPLAWRLLELTLLGRALLLGGLSNPWLAQPAASLLQSQMNTSQLVCQWKRKTARTGNLQEFILCIYTYIYTTWFNR